MMKPALIALAATALTACASKPQQPEAPLTPYACTGFPGSLTADYYTKSGRNRVVLNLGDTSPTLYQTESTTGTRYTNARSNPAKPGSLVWFTKGTEGILYKVTARTNGSAFESQMAYCTSNPQPLAPATLPIPTPNQQPTTIMPGTIPGTAPGVITTPEPSVTI